MAEAMMTRPVEQETDASVPASSFPGMNLEEIQEVDRLRLSLSIPDTQDTLSQLPDLPSALRGTPGDRPERPEMQERRSVQFARLPSDLQMDGVNDDPSITDGQATQVRQPSETKPSRTGALFSKMKIRTPSSRSAHERSASDQMPRTHPIGDRPDGIHSPDSEFVTPVETPRGYTSENEADAESSDEETSNRMSTLQKLKRKTRRPQESATATPTTPMRHGFFSNFAQQSGDTSTRPGFLRRATTTDVELEHRQGVSEDEGRNRLARKTSAPWPRGKRVLPRRNSSNHLAAEETPRPGAFRRALTNLGTHQSPTGGIPPSPWRMRRDQTMSAGAARWKMIKAGLKAIGKSKKLENPMDTIKSAELISELTAGAPAALMIASIFQRDEGGSKKIPILLEQLKVKFTNSQAIIGKSGDRHLTFKIDLEYGSGLTRMNWTIERTLRDFASLHAKYYTKYTKYRVQGKARRYVQPEGDDARSKLPHFPKEILPYLRGVRGFEVNPDAIADMGGDDTAPNSGNEVEKKKGKSRRQHSFNGLLRRQSSLTGDESQGEGLRRGSMAPGQSKKESWPEKSRQKLDVYLQQLMRYLTFRPGTNRLCKFLELSSLGVRLAAEGSYHGKEGSMTILSGKGIDFRRALKPGLFKDRHTPKWFMVRHSYVVCTNSPQDLDVYDVFMVDSDFKLRAKEKLRSTTEPEDAIVGPDGQYKASRRGAGRHHLTLFNSERKVKLAAKNARQLAQFVQSIRTMAHNTPWGQLNRFNSFAPVRRNVHAQWLVDGRDYMWNVSRAISMAKDVIYIHDWWLSPELYLRRPAAIAKKWRLDRLLQRKAQEGVKIFVILYRNVESAIPIDSAYTKLALLDLHPNVFVQRSPNQLRQNTFFWAHHEKICIVDHIIAFVGGVDLCFGRWDTPQHLLADDKPTGLEDYETPKNIDNCQIWPGKDYSNPRVHDFYGLDKAYEEMYDRSQTPRMPWHDIHMQVVGQPARDLTRHFVQRWNFVLRSRVPSRPTPFLLPPPDFAPGELEGLGLDGTCEVQILRSACEWSIGTPGKTEHSIMDAYSTLILQSEHLVYIENQFFISTSKVSGVRIENTIGDALVERIIRAYNNDQKWRAIILIPLVPGFEGTVDSNNGTSIRLIMQCQFRSICRGEESIFGRLRAAGISPEDYIEFYGLRTWGKIGPNQALTTEQLYIHAKCMIVDDRVAIIASANINERSQRGDRDSECGAIVRDTDTIMSTMAGKPYRVGKFPHTLRMRLMREHLGIDVDEMDKHAMYDSDEESMERSQDARNKLKKKMLQATSPGFQDSITLPPTELGRNADLDPMMLTDDEAKASMSSGRRSRPTTAEHGKKKPGGKENGGTESRDQTAQSPTAPFPPPKLPRMITYELGLPQLSMLPALPKTDDTDIGGPGAHKTLSNAAAARVFPMLAKMKRPEILEDCMKDPLNDSFYQLIWHNVAENNTALYRTVFRCQPDNEVVSWKEYEEYMDYAERFSQSQGAGKGTERQAQEAKGQSGPPGAAAVDETLRVFKKVNSETVRKEEIAHGKTDGASDEKRPPTEGQHDHPSESTVISHSPDEQPGHRLNEKHSFEPGTNVTENGTFVDRDNEKVALSSSLDGTGQAVRKGTSQSNELNEKSDFAEHAPKQKIHLQLPAETNNLAHSSSRHGRRGTTRSRRRTVGSSIGDPMAKEDAEELLKLTQGHLVIWPYDWLIKEEEGGNWLYSVDQLSPLEIYD